MTCSKVGHTTVPSAQPLSKVRSVHPASGTSPGNRGHCQVPAQALFPQLLAIVKRYLREFVRVYPPNNLKDIFLSPYYGWVIEKLVAAIRPDTTGGEAPELPRYEANRPPGSTRDVDFWTSREVREVVKSHLNYVVADTRKWEQSAAYYLDTHPNVAAFTKNAGLGFAIPYLHNGQMRDFIPDYIVRLRDNGRELGTLILEVKGYDLLAEEKQAAALRWCAAVNADVRYGNWMFRLVRDPARAREAVESALQAWVSP
jgi:type III restriction enzyme